MSNRKYDNIAPISPGRWVAQALGGIAGGVGGFLDAKREAEAKGEKVGFKDSIDNIVMGGGAGIMNPGGGAMQLFGSGMKYKTHTDNMSDKATMDANAAAAENAAKEKERLAIAQDPLSAGHQNGSVIKNPVFNPSSSAMMRGLYNK